MKSRIALLVFTLLLLSCGNDDDTIPSSEEFLFTSNAMITLEAFDDSSIAQVIEGDNLVFQYRFISENDPDIADEEFSDVIIFEVDPNSDSFSLSNTEIADVNTYFTKYCFCYPINSILISNGSLVGTKQDDGNWLISIDVTFMQGDNQVTKTVSGEFTSE